MSGLKWERMGDHTRVADFGPLRLWAFKQENSDALDVAPFAEIVTYAKDSDAAEAAAEDVARKAYDALREHYDPVPVLRWTTNADDGRSEASVGPWRLVASEHDWTVRHVNGPIVADAGRSQLSSDDSARRAAEAALRALGVSFRVEGA